MIDTSDVKIDFNMAGKGWNAVDRREQKLIKTLLVKRETLTSAVLSFSYILFFFEIPFVQGPQQIITLLRILSKQLIGIKIRSKLINVSKRYQFPGNFIFP